MMCPAFLWGPPVLTQLLVEMQDCLMLRKTDLVGHIIIYMKLILQVALSNVLFFAHLKLYPKTQ